MSVQTINPLNEKILFPIDWQFFANVVLEKLRLLARKKQIDLKVFLAEKDVWLPIKTRHLEYILIELADNAMKFSGNNSEVCIFIQNTTHYLIIRVKDYGIGMPFEILPRIFEKFYQHREHPEKSAGAGLGLSIVKGITRIYGGHIKIVTKPGAGTEVELRFTRYNLPEKHFTQTNLFQQRHFN